MRKEDAVTECKDAERRIGKDVGRFGIVKLRNNAEKIYKYIFTIYKATNQIREAVGRSCGEAVNVKLSAVRVSYRKLSARILNLNGKSSKIQSDIKRACVVKEHAETIVKAARLGK